MAVAVFFTGKNAFWFGIVINRRLLLSGRQCFTFVMLFVLRQFWYRFSNQFLFQIKAMSAGDFLQSFIGVCIQRAA